MPGARNGGLLRVRGLGRGGRCLLCCFAVGGGGGGDVSGVAGGGVVVPALVVVVMMTAVGSGSRGADIRVVVHLQ